MSYSVMHECTYVQPSRNTWLNLFEISRKHSAQKLWNMTFWLNNYTLYKIIRIILGCRWLCREVHMEHVCPVRNRVISLCVSEFSIVEYAKWTRFGCYRTCVRFDIREYSYETAVWLHSHFILFSAEIAPVFGFGFDCPNFRLSKRSSPVPSGSLGFYCIYIQ